MSLLGDADDDVEQCKGSYILAALSRKYAPGAHPDHALDISRNLSYHEPPKGAEDTELMLLSHAIREPLSKDGRNSPSPEEAFSLTYKAFLKTISQTSEQQETGHPSALEKTLA